MKTEAEIRAAIDDLTWAYSSGRSGGDLVAEMTLATASVTLEWVLGIIDPDPENNTLDGLLDSIRGARIRDDK